MSNKDEQIAHLEAEILAARETIKELTRVISDLAKSKREIVYTPPVYVQPYRYTYPYWTYTVGDTVYTSSVGTTSTGTVQFTINSGDDEDGSSIAV